jgi:hypothetical protein
MPSFAPLKTPIRSYQQALDWLSARGFSVSAAASGSRVSKGQCTARIESCADGAAKLADFPALVIGGEPALLVDRGYQKFLKTSKLEMAATAEHLRELHAFSEELKEALGYTSLYNEGLGSVSASYHYDRVKGRE